MLFISVVYLPLEPPPRDTEPLLPPDECPEPPEYEDPPEYELLEVLVLPENELLLYDELFLSVE